LSKNKKEKKKTRQHSKTRRAQFALQKIKRGDRKREKWSPLKAIGEKKKPGATSYGLLANPAWKKTPQCEDL